MSLIMSQILKDNITGEFIEEMDEVKITCHDGSIVIGTLVQIEDEENIEICSTSFVENVKIDWYEIKKFEKILKKQE